MKSTVLSLVVMLGAMSAGSARAAVALSFTGDFIAVASSLTNGWAFTVSSTTVVTHLGIFDYAADGLQDSHSIGIWTDTGSLLATAIIPNGTGATLVDQFRYVGITPVTLLAGRYTIGAYYNYADWLAVTADSITTAPGITYAGPRAIGGSGLAFPAGDNSSGLFPDSYFGPNFQMNVVPEPSSLMLFACAIAALHVRKNRSAKVAAQ